MQVTKRFYAGGMTVSKNFTGRSKLAKVGKQERHTFIATFDRFGYKRAFRGDDVKTLLLQDVRLDGQIVTDHMWFTCGVTWHDLIYMWVTRCSLTREWVPMKRDIKAIVMMSAHP